jgi:isopenicillin N synthase-like dioxygenase
VSAPTAPPHQSFHDIPTVSLAGWTAPGADRHAFASHVVEVCHRVGFFSLVDHGVPLEFFDRLFAGVESFFALPEDVKAGIDKRPSPHFRGWERVGAELTNNRPDHREQLDLSTEHPPRPSSVEPAWLRLDGPNQWLPDDQLPGFHALVEELFTRMGTVADHLMAAISRGLGLEDDELHRRFGERPLSFVKLIHYPPTPPGEAGVNPHHDAGFLTLLAQHGVSGLQARNPDGDWIDVPPVPGALVVNTGEMLQSMTGNYVVATTHRVIAREERYSVGYFHGPDLRTSLHPLALHPAFHEAVAASPRHAGAGFMATRDQLLAGAEGIDGVTAPTYGQQLWNYYVRSYPDNVRTHHPDALP